MTVNAIGGAFGAGAANVQRSGLSENDFIHLFLTQLTFQDPLNPVDDREFLAQLAQFTQIEQSQTLNDNLTGVLEVQAATQAVGLIGKTVEISQNGSIQDGVVTTVSFANGQASLTVHTTAGNELTNVNPSTVVLVRGS